MKTSQKEIVLATLPSAAPKERLQVVVQTSATGGSQIEVRQQSQGDGVGWYTQSSLTLGADQIDDFRAALSAARMVAGQNSAESSCRICEPQSAATLRVVRADSA